MHERFILCMLRIHSKGKNNIAFVYNITLFILQFLSITYLGTHILKNMYDPCLCKPKKKTLDSQIQTIQFIPPSSRLTFLKMPFYLRISAPRLLSSYKISIGICILCVSPSPFSFAIYNSLHIVPSVQDLEAKKYSVFKVYIQTHLCRNQCFRFSMTCILFY